MIVQDHSTLQPIIEKYEQQGYQVEVSPRVEFSGRIFRPDLLAKKNEETLLIEVKPAKSKSPGSYLTTLTELLQNKPGWRLEVVNLPDEENQPLMNMSELESRMTSAKMLIDNSQFEAALLLLWSASEGVLRLIAQKDRLYLEKTSSNFLVKKLYAEGLIDESHSQILQQASKYRNLISHGFRNEPLDRTFLISFYGTIEKLIEQTYCVAEHSLTTS